MKTWALRLAIVGIATFTGCFSVMATDGKAFPDTPLAVQASAAHDFGCPAAAITVKVVYEDIFADGCGWHATYHYRESAAAHWGNQGEVVQVARVAVAAPPPVVAAPPVPVVMPGCAKDTDCKGDRICERGQCTDPHH